MAPFHTKFFTDLLLQAKFSPEKQKLKQLDACESLLQIVQKDKCYPIDFICYHITGYRPKQKSIEQEMVCHEDLIQDIPVYSEKLSRMMRIPSGNTKGKFYTNASLAKHFRVSEKTISRWRKMGLAGRYLVYPDGRLRLAFSDNVVDTFIRINHKRVEKSASFSQILPVEKHAIEQRLIKWAARYPDQRSEAIRRTARKFSRSIEAIRSILIQLESQKDLDRFYKRTTGLSETEGQAIYEAYRNGIAADELVIQFGRSRANIYRAINLYKSRELVEKNIEYTDSHEFQSQNVSSILDAPQDLFKNSVRNTNHVKDFASPNLDSLGQYIHDIYNYEMLTARQEFFLFRKYNFLKYLAEHERSQLDSSMPSGRAMNRIRLYLQQAKEIQNQLLSSNLRLVVHVARKHVNNETDMLEYIGEGNLTLIRSVEKFDFTRGNKFSTYATWALVKRYATLKSNAARQTICVSADEALDIADNLRVPASQIPILEATRKNLDQILTDNLEEREQFILREHFGLSEQNEDTGFRRPRSLTQIAQLVGLSKERVRQIELYALKKLRKVLSVDQFELLTQI